MPSRSNPIAIARNGEDDEDTSDNPSDTEMDGISSSNLELEALDGDDDAMQQEAGSSYKRSAVISLQSHLLRAPRLGSIPLHDDNDEWINQQYPSMLPPAMQTADQPLSSAWRGTENASYGSLRESHTRGRFMDGPSSYRERGTGEIRQYERKVRFHENTIIATSMPTISIGERIMQSRRVQQQQQQQQSHSHASVSTSSLSALLAHSTKAEDQPTNATVPENLTDELRPKSASFYDEEISNQLPDNMLSTSLTGLEVLQAGLGSKMTTSFMSPSPPERHHPVEIHSMNNEELPRNADGLNALLSRSFSDPLPFQRHTPVQARSYSRAGRFAQSERMLATHNLSPLLLGAIHPINQTFRLDENNNEDMSEMNPDTDCAFDLELE